MRRIKFARIILVTLLLVCIPLLIASGYNDFVVVDLRTDIPEVIESLDYQVWLASVGGAGGHYPTYTTAWLSVDLDDGPDPYGKLFSQVGLITDALGIYWFVYAEPGVECLRGEYTYWNVNLGRYLGCKGTDRDLVNYGQWHRVELVKYPGDNFWIARIEDDQQNPFDVAKILSDSISVFDADVSMEEGWVQAQDPFEWGLFHISHPQYNSWADGFRDWPESDGTVNNLYVSPQSICPDYYGAWTYQDNDPRYWVAGSGGIVCSAVMFPKPRAYLPLIIND